MVCRAKNKKRVARVTLTCFSLPNVRWGVIVAILLATVAILFLGAFTAMTGITFSIQPFFQMIGGFLHPGKPMANMYFVLYSYRELSMSAASNPSRLERKN